VSALHGITHFLNHSPGSYGPGLHVADDGLRAGRNIDVLHRDGLRPTSAQPLQGERPILACFHHPRGGIDETMLRLDRCLC
jgi:hypothetical protein